MCTSEPGVAGVAPPSVPQHTLGERASHVSLERRSGTHPITEPVEVHLPCTLVAALAPPSSPLSASSSLRCPSAHPDGKGTVIIVVS